METIHGVIIMLGFSLVGMGLGFAYNFTKSKEKKQNMVEMAYEWKAKMEENAIQKEGIKFKEAA